MVDPSYEEMIEIAIHESIQETIANEAVLASILQKTKRIGVYDDEIKELLFDNIVKKEQQIPMLIF